MALTGKLIAQIVADLTTTGDNAAGGWSLTSNAKKLITIADGVAINQANKVFSDTTAAGTGTTYDLDAGTLLDGNGVAIAAFSRIIAVLVTAPSTNASNVAVGGDFILTKYLTGWVDDALTIPVHPGGFFFWAAPSATGVAVTGTTGDQIVVTPAALEFGSIYIVGS